MSFDYDHKCETSHGFERITKHYLQGCENLFKTRSIMIIKEDVELRRGVDTEQCASEDTGFRREVDCEISH